MIGLKNRSNKLDWFVVIKEFLASFGPLYWVVLTMWLGKIAMLLAISWLAIYVIITIINVVLEEDNNRKRVVKP